MLSDLISWKALLTCQSLKPRHKSNEQESATFLTGIMRDCVSKLVEIVEEDSPSDVIIAESGRVVKVDGLGDSCPAIHLMHEDLS